ncbi:MAG TPA: c-type cytochrome [Usitatibacter sp.]|nr:c-type cytochrome [Usitatibacter sp.]
MRAATVCAALTACAALAHAQQPSFAAPNLTERGVRDMAANCAPCHGTAGKAVTGSGVRKLAGREDVAPLLRAFRDGRRESTVMQQIAKGYTDAEIDTLGGYFAGAAR